MDRREFLTATAAAAVAATALGRVVSAPGPAPARERAASPLREGPVDTPVPAPAPEAAQPSVAARPATRVEVLCRESWGAIAPGAGLVAHTIERITLHHTAVALDDDRLAPARLRRHQHHHRNAGWADIAYHVAVDRRGHVYDLRTHTARGDTFTDYDPAGHFLIVTEGDYDRQEATDAQLDSIAAIAAWAAAEFGVPVGGLSGHRDHASTSCPGDRLYAALPAIRAHARQLAVGTVERVERCGEPAAARVAAIEAGRA